MHQLHFQAEVRAIKDVGLDTAPVSDAELKLAEQLIEHLAAKRFDPNEFHDEFKGRVEAAIQRKVAGKEVSLSEAPVAKNSGNVIDLMDALRASLGAKTAKPELKERKEPKRAEVEAKTRKSARLRNGFLTNGERTKSGAPSAEIHQSRASGVAPVARSGVSTRPNRVGCDRERYSHP